jgi:hypothetical protein
MGRTGALNFYMGDLYPGQAGYFNTSALSLPGPEDQMALVDDEQLAQQNPVDVDEHDHKKVWAAIAVVIGLIVLFSLR